MRVDTLLTNIRSEAVKLLKTDSQMSNRELALIQNALPSLSAGESLSVTTEKINILKDVINLGEFLNRRTIGESMDPLFSRMDVDSVKSFIHKGVEVGLLTRAEAIAAAEQAGILE